MDCLDDADVSIRLQALDLAVGMVTSDTIYMVVSRLLDQLRLASSRDTWNHEPTSPPGENEDSEEQRTSSGGADTTMTLPADYRTEVIHRILDICSQNNYSDLVDFEWYVSTLIQLVGLLPPPDVNDPWHQPHAGHETPPLSRVTAAFRIGSEIRNVAVRVKGVRREATRAAESLLLIDNRAILFPSDSNTGADVLGPVAWTTGEFAEFLLSPSRTLQSLIDPSNTSLPARTLQLLLQAIPKVFVRVTQDNESRNSWKGDTSLLLARVIEFLEAVAVHPDLNVQERAIEFLEVLRLGAEALQSESQKMPVLIASVIPSLFVGLELNPVAVSAQKKVMLPPSLRLDEAFNGDLPDIFHRIESTPLDSRKHHALQDFYHVPDLVPSSRKSFHQPTLGGGHQPDSSYQTHLSTSIDGTLATDRRKLERKERYRDDPFYIVPQGASSSSTSTPPRETLNPAHGDALDLDSIPIIDLRLEDEEPNLVGQKRLPAHHSQPRRMEVAADETLGTEGPLHDLSPGAIDGSTGLRRSLLQVDSSGLGHHSPLSDGRQGHLSGTDEGDAEMRKAMQNVEQVRLRMQRASERIGLEGTPAEGTMVKKKKKSKKHMGSEPSDAAKSAGKKKKKKAHE